MLRFRIILQAPPAGVDFDLQLGKGATSIPVQKQRSNGKDLRFELTLAVVTSKKTGLPDFRGPGVQGRVGERFVYLDIGKYAGQADSPWGRRLKIPLAGITQDLVDRASADPAAVLETRVPGTGRDGGPNCATVKPFDGWKLTV